MTTQTQEQQNWYQIIDSMGRQTGEYVIASNLKEAYEKAKSHPKMKYTSKLKRAYNGGVRG